MDDHEQELAETTAELSETLESLRDELARPPRGPLGLPRPPKPSELLRVTEQYTIPTVVALLEAAIRSLELLGAALRVADGRPIDAITERSGRSDGPGSRDRIAATSRETLRRLDDALAELQSAARGEPSNPEVQALFDEARTLSAKVDERLRDAVAESETETRARTTDPARGFEEIDAESESDDSEPDEIGIDVDEELASIKQDVDGASEADPGSADDTDSNADTDPNVDS
jgi:hypothetical protein